MKRSIAFILAAAFLFTASFPAFAYAPQIINYALYTDIVAKIDGHPLRSYDIDGYTAVVAEDLRSYGFYALWNGEERSLPTFCDFWVHLNRSAFPRRSKVRFAPFFFNKKNIRPLPCSSFFAKSHANVGCSVVNALATPLVCYHLFAIAPTAHGCI